jgi:signal transduction histidine kinase
VLVVVAFGLPLTLSLRDRVAAEVRSQARSQADLVAASAAELLTARAAPQLHVLVTTSADAVRGRVVVVDPRGRVLDDSAGAAGRGTPYRGRPEITAALRGRETQAVRRSATLGADILATAVPVRHGPGPPRGAVRVTQSVRAVNSAVRRATAWLTAIAVAVVGLGLAAGAVFARRIARPIDRLDAAVRRVAAGDFDARADVEGSAEQRRLAHTFNAMTQRTARLVRGQQAFVADASHQLRTPLAGVRLRLEEARALSSGPAVAELDAGMREVDRLAEIINELLVLSRSGERDLPGEPVDLAAAARRAVDRWAPAAREGNRRLECDGARGGQAWCAAADADRILDSLVENALRYSPPGSTVRVRATGGAIEVLDEGPGIATGEEDAVFERFHRGSAARDGAPGTGLGLPIARELAAVWGASVTLATREGGGARACVRFAPAGGAPPAGAAVTAATPRPPGRRRSARRRPARATALVAAAAMALAGGVTYATGRIARQPIGLAGEPPSAIGAVIPPRPSHDAAAGRTRSRRPTTTASPQRPAPAAPAPAAGDDGAEGADD